MILLHALHLRLKTTEVDSRPLRVNCPVCGAKGVPTKVSDLRQTVALFGRVPLLKATLTVARCSCGADLVADRRAAEFEALSAESASRFLSVRISPILKTLVLGGILMVPIAGIGTVWLGFAYAWARKYSGWVRTLALVLLVLSCLLDLLCVVGLFLPDPSRMPLHPK